MTTTTDLAATALETLGGFDLTGDEDTLRAEVSVLTDLLEERGDVLEASRLRDALEQFFDYDNGDRNLLCARLEAV